MWAFSWEYMREWKTRERERERSGGYGVTSDDSWVSATDVGGVTVMEKGWMCGCWEKKEKRKENKREGERIGHEVREKRGEKEKRKEREGEENGVVGWTLTREKGERKWKRKKKMGR